MEPGGSYLSILSIYLSMYVYVCLFVYMFVSLPVYLSIYVSIYISICLSMFICLSARINNVKYFPTIVKQSVINDHSRGRDK